MRVKDLENLLMRMMGLSLKDSEKEAIWETFKVKESIEDNPDKIDDRVIGLQALLNARKVNKKQKVQDLINIEQEDEQNAEDFKNRGLEYVDENFIIKMALQKKDKWGGIWRTIKTIDKDSNGFVTPSELEEIFKEWFPLELNGKTLVNVFKKYRSETNKNFINYKLMKDYINGIIIT